MNSAMRTTLFRVMIVEQHSQQPVHGSLFWTRCWVVTGGAGADCVHPSGLVDVFFPAPLFAQVAKSGGSRGKAVTLMQWREVVMGEAAGDHVVFCTKHTEAEAATADELATVPLGRVEAPGRLDVRKHSCRETEQVALDEPAFQQRLQGGIGGQLVGTVQRVTLLPIIPQHNITTGNEPRALLLVSTQYQPHHHHQLQHQRHQQQQGKLCEVVIKETVAARNLELLLHAAGHFVLMTGLRSAGSRCIDALEQKALRCFGPMVANGRIERKAATDAFSASFLRPPASALGIVQPQMRLCTLGEVHEIASAGSGGDGECEGDCRVAVVGVVGHVTEEALWLVDETASVRIETAGYRAATLAVAGLGRGDVVLLRNVEVGAGRARIDRLSTAEKMARGAEDSVTACGGGWLIVERGVEAAVARADPLLDAGAGIAGRLLAGAQAAAVPSFEWKQSALGMLVSVSGRIAAADGEASVSVCDQCGKAVEVFPTKGEESLFVCRRCACLSAHKEGLASVTLHHDDGACVGTLRVTASGNAAVEALRRSCIAEQQAAAASIGVGVQIAGLVCTVCCIAPTLFTASVVANQ